MINEAEFEKIRINISQVVKERLPKYWDYIPRPLLNMLSNLCQQDKLNDLLRNNLGKTGVEFCRAVLSRERGYDSSGEVRFSSSINARIRSSIRCSVMY